MVDPDSPFARMKRGEFGNESGEQGRRRESSIFDSMVDGFARQAEEDVGIRLSDAHHGIRQEVVEAAVVEGPEEPVKAGVGPDLFTTACSLVLWPYVCWDVNGYYAELGLTPRASKLEIRKAYEALDGQASGRLTYIVKQLLNDEVRQRYDACQLGDQFFDTYVEDWVKAEMIRSAAEARAAGVEDDSAYEPIDLSEYMNQVLDSKGAWSKNGGSSGRTSWGYWLWGTWSYDLTRVMEWRAALLAAFSATGEVMQLAVGLRGGESAPDFEVITIKDRTVAFIHERELDQSLEDLALRASRAVAHQVAQLPSGPVTTGESP